MSEHENPGRMVVGVGEVEADRAAVTWAAEHAHTEGLALHLLHAVPEVVTGDVAVRWFDADLDRYVNDRARDLLEQLAEQVTLEFPELPVTFEVVHDRPRRALLRASRGATMVACGAGNRSWVRRHGPSGLQLGSTSLYLAAQLSCPIGVVRALPLADARGVVVGTDGSQASRAAVEFAADQADADGEPLRLVQAWSSAARHGAGWSSSMLDELRAVEESSHRHSVEALAAELVGARPGLHVDVDLLEGVETAQALVDLAAPARLLVIGARGRGAFAAALLGSTGHSVLHAATGPVVVVPDPGRVAVAAQQVPREQVRFGTAQPLST